MTDPTSQRQVDSALEGFAASVRDTVAANRSDLALDQLVWAHAYAAAARALGAWADASGDVLAGELAAAGRAQALDRIAGAGAVARVERDAQLAAIATRLRPLADVGADHQHVLLRTTLRQFADKEVRPHAERIHRDDADIPDAVIAGVAALGLLGISIPEAYGGFQAEPDSRAMLVATEELSSASLGAAGSLMTRPEILVRALLRAGTEGRRNAGCPASPTADCSSRCR